MADLLTRLQSALMGHYTIERELGRGGMAHVFLAQDVRHHRTVAVKVLRPELAAALGPERFLREIEIAARLTHPHIVPLYDSGHAGGVLFYVMPYVEGESLRDRLKREKQLPVEDTLQVAREVLDALSYAHGHAVIHRDIKPENILLTAGHAVVTDFGIARAITAAGGEQLTEPGLALGTPAYMSPEQAGGGKDVDGRSDLYSLGCVLYEMLAGQPPFLGPTTESVVHQHLAVEAPAVRAIRGAVPEPVADAIRRALAKVPADRFPTAAEFARTLPGRGIADAVPRGWRHPPRWQLASVTAVAALGIVAYLTLARGRGVAGAGPESSRKMLVVLPFVNLGPPADEFFADGITEEITARLSSLHELGVISRTSAIQYKKSPKPLRQIGQELGVDYVLEGTIRWERAAGGSRVRVTPQLIRVADDTHLWAHPYDAVLADIFQVQSSIAEQVGHALDVALGPPERRALEVQPTQNLEAYTYYLQGNDHAQRNSERERRNALAMYERAVQLDARFALAYAKLAQTHAGMYWFYEDHTDQRLALAKRAADRALELDPDLPETQIALGFYYYWGYRDYDRALRYFAVAQQHQPNNGAVWAAIGYIERRQGQFDRALVSQRKAVELDPRSASLETELGNTYMAVRNFAEAERANERAISLAPEQPYAYVNEVRLYLRQGSLEKARHVLERASANVDPRELAREAVTPALVGVPRRMIRALTEEYRDALSELSLASFGADTASYYLAKATLAEFRQHPGLEHAYADSARAFLEGKVRARPAEDQLHARLAVAYADLGRKDEAVREARQAVTLLPVNKDAVAGVVELLNLVEIYVKVGEPEAAIDQLELLMASPLGLTVSELRADPFWAPLRGNPRFQRLLRSN
ncbi:MAG TPA: protein kinase [Gemmatimonadales bacterium]|nr:protein kinase [Gemmatimonadales bacterium]